MDDTLVDYFSKGGPFVWPIVYYILNSLVLGGIWIWLNRRAFNPFIADQILQIVESGNPTEALETCRKHPANQYANLLAEGIGCHLQGSPREEIEATTRAQISVLYWQLRNTQTVLYLWIGVALIVPILTGALGYFSGEIQMFNAIIRADAVTREIFKIALNEARIPFYAGCLASLFGLIVALAVLSLTRLQTEVHGFLRHYTETLYRYLYG